MQPWKNLITEIAKRPNVGCKVSGMVTEADWRPWSVDDLRPYVDHILTKFGTERVKCGSDWPVCLLAASYDRVVAAAEKLLAELSKGERQTVAGGNAIQFYRLEV